MEKVKTIRIYHENKMLISDWAIFLIGIFLVGSFLLTMMDLINDIQDESNKILAMIVLLFAFIKIIFWVKLPTHYTTEDLIEDLKIN